MKKILTVFALQFFLIHNLFAEIVNKVEISGNKRISSETIKIYGEIELNKNYLERDIDKVLKNIYSTNFFEDVKIELKNKVLKINVKEYPVVNQLIIVGETSNKYKEQIKKVIKLKEKRSLIKSYLASDVDLIKDLYSSLGYNSAKIDAKLKKNDDQNFDLLINIDRGSRTKILSINFIGNENIRARRLRDVLASEEDKFWKIITKNTNLSENLINLDIRLLTNYYRSLGFYDAKVTSNLAKINLSGKAELVYSIEEGKRYTINKISTNVDPVFDKKLFFPLESFVIV